MDLDKVQGDIFPPFCTATCPLEGTRISYTWTMRRSGPFPCGSGFPPLFLKQHSCQMCNASCRISQLVLPDPAASQQMCETAVDHECFQLTDQPETVLIKPGCFGCLTCSGENKFGDGNSSAEFDFQLKGKPVVGEDFCCNLLTWKLMQTTFPWQGTR